MPIRILPQPYGLIVLLITYCRKDDDGQDNVVIGASHEIQWMALHTFSPPGLSTLGLRNLHAGV